MSCVWDALLSLIRCIAYASMEYMLCQPELSSFRAHFECVTWMFIRTTGPYVFMCCCSIYIYGITAWGVWYLR